MHAGRLAGNRAAAGGVFFRFGIHRDGSTGGFSVNEGKESRKGMGTGDRNAVKPQRPRSQPPAMTFHPQWVGTTSPQRQGRDAALPYSACATFAPQIRGGALFTRLWWTSLPTIPPARNHFRGRMRPCWSRLQIPWSSAK